MGAFFCVLQQIASNFDSFDEQSSLIHSQLRIFYIRLSKPKVLIAKKNGKHNIVRLFFFFHAFLEFRGAHPLVFDVSTYFPLPNFLFFCGERVLYCRQTREITGTPFCFAHGKLFFSHRIAFACNTVSVPFLIRCHPIYICYI